MNKNVTYSQALECFNKCKESLGKAADKKIAETVGAMESVYVELGMPTYDFAQQLMYAYADVLCIVYGCMSRKSVEDYLKNLSAIRLKATIGLASPIELVQSQQQIAEKRFADMLLALKNNVEYEANKKVYDLLISIAADFSALFCMGA